MEETDWNYTQQQLRMDQIEGGQLPLLGLRKRKNPP